MSLGVNALFMALAVALRQARGEDDSPRGAVRYRPSWGQVGKDAVWVPSPAKLLDDILDMARVAPGERLLDLGAGDGRIVIAAARRGAYTLGLEYDPRLVRLARRNVRAAGVADRVWVRCGDLFEADLSAADIITFYLLPHLNLRLRPKLLALAPGTRVVSQSFGMGEWRADAQVVREGRCAYLWIVPAQIGGVWRLLHDDGRPPVRVRVTQHFQYLQGEAEQDVGAFKLRDGRLRGADISFTSGRLGTGRIRYEGRVEGAAMRGTGLAADGRRFTWTARRLADAS